MYNLIKPGHVLMFSTCPQTINSPPVANFDNTAVTLWPNAATLGNVRCVSHPSGEIGKIAAKVAVEMRGPAIASRSLSYSGIGRAMTDANRTIGQDVCDFVGYVDGCSYYTPSNRTVFSKDFSGCIMAAYTVAGQRRVAHAAASSVPEMDCKQGFLTAIQGQAANLHGRFRPFVDANDGARRFNAYNAIKNFVGNNPYAITTFGVMTAGNVAYAIDAFKPTAGPPGAWVVTYCGTRTTSISFVYP